MQFKGAKKIASVGLTERFTEERALRWDLNKRTFAAEMAPSIRGES